MSPPTTLEKAEYERSLIKTYVVIMEQALLVRDTTPLDQTECELMVSQIIDHTEKLEKLHMKILGVRPENLDEHVAEFVMLTKSIFNCRVTLETLLKAYPAPIPVHVPVVVPPMAVKLAPLDLPTFSGKYEEWSSFMDLFEGTIHNSNHTDATKLAYLKKYVVGDAGILIKNFTTTNSNYSEAWNVLKSRFNNQREIVFTQVRRLFNIVSCKQGNANTIQAVLDQTNECLRALTVLNEPTDMWGTLLVHMTVEKLDNETKRQWALSLQGTVPKFSELCTFLEQHIRGLHAYHGPATSTSSSSNKQHVQERKANAHFSNSDNTNINQCQLCRSPHPIFKCEKFLAMTTKERSQIATKNNLCFNCLRPGSKMHNAETCKGSACRTCNKKHNTLLHYQRPPSQNDDKSQGTTTKSNHVREENFNSDVLLATAVVTIPDENGYHHEARIMLDIGSQATLVSESFVKRCGFKRRYDKTKVTGVGGTDAGYTKGKTTFTLTSKVYNESIPVTALILPEVTDDMPQLPCVNNHDHIAGITLADPNYYKPSPIDLILGAEFVPGVLRDGKIKGIDATSPTALNTIFGWVLAGRVGLNIDTCRSVRVNVCEINNILEKYLEQETVQVPKHMTLEEKECEEQFVNTYKRGPDGKFCVALPFNNNLQKLGASRDMAVKRWKSVERRLAKNPAHALEYHKFMREYLDLGHMSSIPRGEVHHPSPSSVYYLPHHFVEKQDSTTTKFRVVFDGSAKSTTGVSINDCLKVGATVQDDIFSLLLRFRQHKIAIKADIAKMFRQFRVKDDHCNFQRIVYRENMTDELRDYKLLTVTYGTACAPFLATRCLVELAKQHSDIYPVAAQKLLLDAYVDDLMSGSETVEDAMTLIQQLNTIVESAGLCFRKWLSSNAEVFESIPQELRECNTTLSLDKDSSVKALGVQWNAFDDLFSFTKPQCEVNVSLTKRDVLSQLARVYDPLGFLSPVTINAKLFMQQLWKCKMGWDEKLSEFLFNQWAAYQEQLKCIELIRIPRWVKAEQSYKFELHGFCDASEKAYGAVVYMRCSDEANNHSVKMLASKSRVASLKTVCLPRLELCGSLLLSELLESVKASLNVTCDMYGWTDSMIVLYWLASHPGRWQTYVANRVSKIQEILPIQGWNHVRSEENPADLVSRGVTASSLHKSSLWWHGPHWLATNNIPEKVVTVKENISSISSKLLEERKQIIQMAHVNVGASYIERFSSLTKLNRVTAYILRWATYLKTKQLPKGPLTVAELQHASLRLVSMVQREAFPNDFTKLQSNKNKKTQVSATSKLLSLNPFMDTSACVIRVGGRLQHANINNSAKHPMILPNNSHFTTLLIRHAHLTNWHGSNKLVWRTLQHQWWILRARNTIKSELRKCVKCRRGRAKAMSQIMADLRPSRVNIGHAFKNVGVDYAGPFNMRVISGRSNVKRKCYMCIFVCLATKAVHIEAASGMSTETFIAALDRFVSTRGFPETISSDCGTNFVGADREMRQILASDQHNNMITNHISDRGIQWIFNTPSAPHHGGIWEAAVKSAKTHLRKVIGDSTLNFEEFQTVFKKVEACLNSRPLCAMTSDPDDLDVLTPGHFLIGRPMISIPSPDVTAININRLSRWQIVQQMQQQFWRRWQVEYLSTLQQRWKWKTEAKNISVGDLCVLLDENLPPTKWKLVRVTETHLGQDNNVRRVTVKSADSSYERPIVKLSPILFVEEQ